VPAPGNEQRKADRSGAHVLDPADLGIDREIDAIGQFFDGGVQQLDHEDESNDGDEREALPRLFGNQEGDRYRQHEGYQFLAKSLLAARRGAQAMPGIDGGAQQPFHGVR